MAHLSNLRKHSFGAVARDPLTFAFTRGRGVRFGLEYSSGLSSFGLICINDGSLDPRNRFWQGRGRHRRGRRRECQRHGDRGNHLRAQRRQRVRGQQRDQDIVLVAREFSSARHNHQRTFRFGTRQRAAMIVDRAKSGGWAMTRISRRDFGVSVGALAVSTFTFGKGRATTQSQLEGYPIAPDVSTTLRRTVVPGPTPSAKI